MLVEVLVSPFFATNCWIIATGKGQECVIVDPGIGVPDLTHEINETVLQFNLKPVAVLLTHGHLDHIFSVTPLSKTSSARTAYIHSNDRELLTNPTKALSPESRQWMKELAQTTGRNSYTEPDDVREIKSGDQLEIAGMNIRVIHAPGHTRGSVIFTIKKEEEEEEELAVTGDVLFAGAIGRTDLPTGSPEEMEKTLREKVIPLADHFRVLPGHGPESTMEREKRSNQYLKDIMSGKGLR